MFDPFPASERPALSPRAHRGRRAGGRLAALADHPPWWDDERCPDEPPWPEDPEAVRRDAVEHPAGATGPERSAPAAPAAVFPGGGRLVERWLPGVSSGWRRWSPRFRGRPWIVLLAVAAVVAVATAVGMLNGSPRAEQAPALPVALPPAVGAASTAGAAPSPSRSPRPARIVVSVVGKVAHPGLVTLRTGARVADALRAAGGTPSGTDVTALNLARKLSDGEQIYVGIPVPPGASPAPQAAGAGGSAGGGSGQKVDLNTATAEQLDGLPGVGEVTAQSILDWRAQHGRFASVGQLNEIDGIGEVRFGKLKDLVTVG